MLKPFKENDREALDSGVKLIFTRGHISFAAAFKGPNVVSGLHKCKYSLTGGKELCVAAG